MTVQITRLEHDADALHQHAARASAAPVAWRLLALALVLEGHGRAVATRSCGMDRQTLRDWVIRYNEHGIAGLSDLAKRGAAAAKLTVEEKAVLAGGFNKARISRKMAWCAGGYAICVGGTGRNGRECDRLRQWSSQTAEWQVGRALPGSRLVHEALWCGIYVDPTACKVMQLWLQYRPPQTHTFM